MCTSLSTQGMNFLRIEKFILERRMDKFARKQEIHKLHMEITGKEATGKSLLSKTPSNDIILKEEYLYLQHINSIETSSTISFVKVAANIGFCREDGTWVPQYNSLFIIMNDKGKVLTWQLTRGIYCFLRNRGFAFRPKETVTKYQTCFIDDCCKLRSIDIPMGSWVCQSI